MTVVNFRLDPESAAALAELTREGESRSDVLRRALRDAVRLQRRELMRAEAIACVSDAADLAETARVAADLDDLRAW